MSTPAPAHGGIDTDNLGGGEPNPRCAWYESVCLECPEYFLVRHTPRGEVASVYCARHYVLELAELLEVHLPSCTGSAGEHIARFGALS